jgi:hypothetical protein
MRTPSLVQREGMWCARIAATATFTTEPVPRAARPNRKGAIRNRVQEQMTWHYEVPLWTSDRATAEERLRVLLGQKEGSLPDPVQAMRSFYLERKR